MKNVLAKFLRNSKSYVGSYLKMKVLSPGLKKFGKIRFGFKLSLGLIYGLSFRIQTTSYFPKSWVHKTGLIFYLADFHGRNWRIPGFYENKTPHFTYSLLKPKKFGYIFIGPNSLSQTEDLAAVNHVTQAAVRVGSKIGS